MDPAVFSRFPFNIILASASPRRKELLSGLGLSFKVEPVHADESWPGHLAGRDIALYLARMKAEAYPRELAANDLLIAADTIVWQEGSIFNKPADFAEGKKMLRALSGKAHEVFTAVCIRTASGYDTFCDASKVYFKELSAPEIEFYLENYGPYDKAGGYGVQDWIGYVAIDKIEGSFYTVMGLPVKQVYEKLYNYAVRKE